MRRVDISLPGGGYPVFIGEGSLSLLGELMPESLAPGRLLLVTDRTVSALYGPSCLRSLEAAGFRVFTAEIPPGERSKSFRWAVKLYDTAVEAGLDRASPVVALGGGVTGDLAGFVAATYLRGVPLVQVPTTLLAQVDSSVGGKVAVNHPRGKNLVGAFYQPCLVVMDPLTLRSLPDRELKAGAAELIKHGILGERSFFEWLDKNLSRLLVRDPAVLIEALAQSVITKGGVVESDEKEEGRRRILNLGHTFAHALEAATGYDYYLHGEAVLIGMDMAVSLAEKLGLLSLSRAGRLHAMFRRVGLVEPPRGLKLEPVMEKLLYDKKRKSGRLLFVLPCDEGVRIYPDPPGGLLKEIFNRYLDGFQ